MEKEEEEDQKEEEEEVEIYDEGSTINLEIGYVFEDERI